MELTGTGLSFDEDGIAGALIKYSLVVPLNQRSYAWTEQHVDVLLNDLTKAFSSGDPIYFLGMIVLTQNARGQCEVADGQQRLATISIMLAAIRDYMIELGDNEGAAKYQQDYLIEYEPRSKGYKAKLCLNYEDNAFFEKTILRPPQNHEEYQGRTFSSHERLAATAKKAAEHIRNLTAVHNNVEDKLRVIYDWVDYLRKSATVIIIMVPGYVGNVFKMFETLNARGLRASQADILKNYLFDKGKDKLSDIQPRWTTMVSNIESLGEDDLLITYIRHYWIAHNGPTTEKELGDKIEQTIRSERQAVDAIISLDSFSGDYVALLTPREHPRWNEFDVESRNCIFTITHELRVQQILSLMLSISRYFTVEEAKKAFKLCLSWSVRFLIVGGGGGGVLDRQYGLCAQDVSKRSITTAKELADKMLFVVPNDEAFKASFGVATVRRTNLMRYYLRALELYIKEDPYPAFVPNENTRAINIEHILPANPESGWNIPPDIAASYHKRIGNMVLLRAEDNSKIGNKLFDTKKPVLKDCPYITTQWAAEYETWGIKEITDRQNKLANLAVKVWSL